MSAFAPITLEDGAGTPVTHTFKPSSIDPNGVARLYEDTDEGLETRNALSLGVKLPKTGSSVARVTAKVVMPVMDSENPALKIGEMIGNVEFVIPKQAVMAQRKDLRAFVANFMLSAEVEAAVESLEAIY